MELILAGKLPHFCPVHSQHLQRPEVLDHRPVGKRPERLVLAPVAVALIAVNVKLTSDRQNVSVLFCNHVDVVAVSWEVGVVVPVSKAYLLHVGKKCLTHSFLPTGRFMAPKIIILIKCLIEVLFSKVLF